MRKLSFTALTCAALLVLASNTQAGWRYATVQPTYQSVPACQGGQCQGQQYQYAPQLSAPVVRTTLYYAPPATTYIMPPPTSFGIGSQSVPLMLPSSSGCAGGHCPNR